MVHRKWPLQRDFRFRNPRLTSAVHLEATDPHQEENHDCFGLCNGLFFLGIKYNSTSPGYDDFLNMYSFDLTANGLWPDWTYHITLIGMGLLTELSIGVLVSCLPVLPRFFQHVGPMILPSCFSTSRPSDDIPSRWRSDRSPSKPEWELLKGESETTTTTTGSLEDGSGSTDSRAQTDIEASEKGG
ncbi:MAG: hypothetical protein Q9186_004557 [Xanthomendoza sp. 1 TL-2023]